MRKDILMTTCKCGGREPGDLIINREYLDDVIRRKEALTKTATLAAVIKLLEQHKQMWFSQSLTAGSSAFWNNKVKTTNELIKEIEEML